MQQEYSVITHNSYAIRLSDIKLILEHYPYGYPYRVALTLLALTGMRVSELERVSHNSFRNNLVVWKLGKNQSGSRQVLLPGWFMEELKHYLDNYPHPRNKLFNFKPDNLRRKIHDIREKLGGNFTLAKPSTRNKRGKEYLVGLKSFRHTYQCVLFWKYWKKFKSAELAAAFVSKEMKHSGTSFGLTAKHYISSIDYLHEELTQLDSFLNISQAIRGVSGQSKLLEFY